MGGQVVAMIDNLPTQLGAIKAGRVRALGVTSLKRAAQLPAVPTIAESGVPGFEVTVWLGVCAPAAVAKPIIAKLNADIVTALNAPDVQRSLAEQGIEARPSTPGNSGRCRAEIARWAKAVKDPARLD